MYAYPPPLPEKPLFQERLVALSQDLKAAQGVLALYIHVPFCLHFCHFCGFIKSKYEHKSSHAYVDLLCKEIRGLGSASVDRPIASIYFGGGTPSTLLLEQVDVILAAIRSSFEIIDGAEFSFEGEVRTLLKPGYMTGLRRLGVNRLSFGVQTLRADLRQMLNLRPTLRQLQQAMAIARDLFDDVCIDMMTGWPGLTADEQIDDVLECVRALRPPSIEVFRFEVLDSAPPFAMALAKGFEFPRPFDELKALDLSLSEALERQGYGRLSYTLFRRRDAVQTDLVYYGAYYGWNAAEVLGVGVGAQSFINGLMRGSVESLAEYEECVRAGRPAFDSITRYDPVEKERVTWPRRGFIPARLIEESPPDYRAKIAALERAGLVLSKDGTVRLLDWSFVEPIMHFLLKEEVRSVYENASAIRAKERGLLPHREVICV